MAVDAVGAAEAGTRLLGNETLPVPLKADFKTGRAAHGLWGSRKGVLLRHHSLCSSFLCVSARTAIATLTAKSIGLHMPQGSPPCDAGGVGSSAVGLDRWPWISVPRSRVFPEGNQDETSILNSRGLCCFLDHLLLLPNVGPLIICTLLCPVFHDPGCGFNYSE